MLNFPKIKKFIYNEDKLIQYLQDDKLYQDRNYEVDFQNKLIRKKHVKERRDKGQFVDGSKIGEIMPKQQR